MRAIRFDLSNTDLDLADTKSCGYRPICGPCAIVGLGVEPAGGKVPSPRFQKALALSGAADRSTGSSSPQSRNVARRGGGHRGGNGGFSAII